MKLSKIIGALSLGLFLLNFPPLALGAQTAPNVSLEVSAVNVLPDSFVEVKISASSESAVNAFDIVLLYSPKMFSFERAYTGRSVASLWKSMPFEDQSGSISLVGGSTKPWSGSGNEIITLVFKAREVGDALFAISEADFALADGLGTKVRTSSQSQEVAVSPTGSSAGLEILSGPPVIAGVFIENDPLTKNPVVILETPDAGSIKWLGIRSRSWLFWSDWQKTQLATATIPKYSWATQLKALGFDGEESVTTLYRWGVAFNKILIILVVLISMILAGRFFKKRSVRLSPLGLWLAMLVPMAALLFASPTHAATLSLSPAGGAFSVGSTFDVQILLNTEGQSINAIDIRLVFPPNILQVVPPTAGQSIIGVWTSPPRFDNQTGEIILQGGIPEGISVSQGVISTITFRARQTGNAALRFLDSSKVLLHDGKGTDALSVSYDSIFRFLLPPPAGPLVASETHPDQTLWYANPNPLLRWANANPVAGYSFVLNDIPVSTPDNIVDSAEKSVAYKNLPSGTHYFHIKALRESDTWGGITNFAINIDVEAPAAFPIEVRPASRTTSKTVFLHFASTDQHSGIDRYEYSVMPLNPESFIEEASAYQTFFVETNSPEIVDLDRGRYDIIVRAYDKAGNFRENTERVSVLSPLTFYATSPWTLAVALVLVLILILAYRHVQKWHRSLEQKRQKKELPQNIKEQLEQLKNYRNKYGTMVFLIGLFGGFLLFSNQVSAQGSEVIELAPPLITTISRNISNEDIFYIGGKTNNAKIGVNIYLQNLGTGETRSFLVISDEDGDWFYRHPTFLPTGEYLLWTQSLLEELASPPSPQVKMNVDRTAIQFGSNRLSFETLYLIIVVILLIAMAVLIVSVTSMIKKGREKHAVLMKEVREAEESVRRGFAVLKRDIEAELALIRQVKLSKEISQEEKQKEEQLMKDLAEVEGYVGKEIWDIEKYA